MTNFRMDNLMILLFFSHYSVIPHLSTVELALLTGRLLTRISTGPGFKYRNVTFFFSIVHAVLLFLIVLLTG